jgi:hypothetical protein
MQTASEKPSLCLVNTQLTMAHLCREDNRIVDCVSLIDHIFGVVTLKDKPPKRHDPKHHIPTRMFPFQQELLKVDILLECCALFRSMDNLDKAQKCIEEAWIILYSPMLTQLIFPMKEKEVDLLNRSQPCHDETKCVTACREIPILRGWRLSSGMGWGMADTFDRGRLGRSDSDSKEFSVTRMKFTSYEADVLAECAKVLLCRIKKDKIDHDGYDDVKDVLSLALSADPNHFQSKLLLASLCVDTIEKKDVSSRQLSDLVQAVEYAQAALREDGQSSDAW